MLEEGRELARVYCAGGEGSQGGPPCCRCARRGGRTRGASPLACLAVCALVLAYNLLGGLLFLALEGGGSGGGGVAEETAVAASKPDPSGASHGAELRARTVHRLWAITEDLNILYKENWTALAARELLAFQRALLPPTRALPRSARTPRPQRPPSTDHRWTFSTSSLYALTLITTIGHGNVTPSSASGKLAAVVYACAGIPLVMLYLACVGGTLARGARGAWARLRAPRRAPRPPPHPGGRTPFQAALNLASLAPAPPRPCRAHARVPVPLSLALLLLYVAAGATLFHVTEQWDLLDGCFFAFSSLATIGFGNLRPGQRAGGRSAAAEDLALAACCLYILVGVVVVAMCFDLVQEQLGAVLRRVAGGGTSRTVHVEESEEKAGMSLVS